jgi:hypothetical protein
MISPILPVASLAATSHRRECRYVFLISVPFSALGQETDCHGRHRFCAGSVRDLHRGSFEASWLSPFGNHGRPMARPVPDPWLVSEKSIFLSEYAAQPLLLLQMRIGRQPIGPVGRTYSQEPLRSNHRFVQPRSPGNSHKGNHAHSPKGTEMRNT